MYKMRMRLLQMNRLVNCDITSHLQTTANEAGDVFKTALHSQRNNSTAFNAFDIVVVLEDLWKDVLEDLTNNSETIRIFTEGFGKRATKHNENIASISESFSRNLTKKSQTIPIGFLKPLFSALFVEFE